MKIENGGIYKYLGRLNSPIYKTCHVIVSTQSRVSSLSIDTNFSNCATLFDVSIYLGLNKHELTISSRKCMAS